MHCWLGVDGTRSGWVVFVLWQDDSYHLWHADKLKDLELLLLHSVWIQAIAIDIPLGLLDKAQRGGRGCDREARRLLSSAKRNARMSKGLSLVGPSSIFTPPSRPALAAFCKGESHAKVSEANRKSGSEGKEQGQTGLGLSIQVFHIMSKIKEADDFVSPIPQASGLCSLSTGVPTLECHPELAFLSLSRCKALYSKKVMEGRKQRLDLLCQKGVLNACRLLPLLAQCEPVGDASQAIQRLSRQRACQINSLRVEDKSSKTSVLVDDVLDAMVCAITSRNWTKGIATAVCEGEEVQNDCDTRRLPMLIWK